MGGSPLLHWIRATTRELRLQSFRWLLHGTNFKPRSAPSEWNRRERPRPTRNSAQPHTATPHRESLDMQPQEQLIINWGIPLQVPPGSPFHATPHGRSMRFTAMPKSPRGKEELKQVLNSALNDAEACFSVCPASDRLKASHPSSLFTGL